MIFHKLFGHHTNKHICSIILILFFCCIVNVTPDCCENSILPELTFRLSGNRIQWPCLSTRNIYSSSGRYVPRNIIGTRSQIFHDQAIVAFPRYRCGVPITLGRICLKKGSCHASVEPFPCWSIQEEGNCQALQSVVDIFLDSQNILWVLDVGIVHTLEQPVRRCPPKVVAIHMRTGKVVKVIDLSNMVEPSSRLQYLVVDYDLEGRAYVYISDAGGKALLVHDVSLNRNYRVLLPGPCTCHNNDVLYIVLIRKSCGQNVLYFTYLGSSRLFSIKTEHLRKGRGSGAIIDVGPKPGGKSIVLLGSDNGASLFLRYKGDSDIYLWNTETCFKASNFLEIQKGGDCRLATQVIPGYRRFMWAIESNFQDFIANTVGCTGASVLIHPLVRQFED